MNASFFHAHWTTIRHILMALRDRRLWPWGDPAPCSSPMGPVSRVNSRTLFNCRALIEYLFYLRCIPEPLSGRMKVKNWKEEKGNYNPDRLLRNVHVYLCPPGSPGSRLTLTTASWGGNWGCGLPSTREHFCLQKDAMRVTSGSKGSRWGWPASRSADVTLTWGRLSASIGTRS